MKKFIVYFLAAVMCFGLVAGVSAKRFGDSIGKLGKVAGDVGLEANLGTSVGAVIQGALALVGTIFLILMVYAGILWMTASGNEEKVTQAKQIVIAATIGVAIAMSAYAITFYVTSKVGNVPVSPTAGQ